MGYGEYDQETLDTEIASARKDEIDRCAQLCGMRADISRASAAKLRKDGSYTVRCLWPFMAKRTLVAPKWEDAAQDMESVAHAFDVVADCIRRGYDPRKLKPDPTEQIEPIDWDKVTDADGRV
jgi:hypothetical protein